MILLALVWHMHQPPYGDPATGRPALPWARLHALRDYWGMGALLEEAPPGVAVTVDFSGSCLDQVEAAAAGAQDRLLELSLRRPDSLSGRERAELALEATRGNPMFLARRAPRLAELKRRVDSGESLSEQDLLDAQVLGALAWVHPIRVEAEPAIRALAAKGRGFTLGQRDALLGRLDRALGEVVPLWARLAREGRAELAAAPQFHPILPLLLEPARARESLPDRPLPARWKGAPEDAGEHLSRVVSSHARRFGAPPAGLWPSEGAISPEVVEPAVAWGFRWMASGEEVLERSLSAPLRDQPDGEVQGPDLLYRPWRVRGPAGGEILVLFRERLLSDLISFSYAKEASEAAAAGDLLGRLRRLRDRSGSETWLVTVVLDGENAWETYPEHGVRFLRTLYRGLAAEPGIRAVRVSDAIANGPEPRILPRLHTGSWIRGDLAIWAGHREDLAAWDLLADAREACRGCADPGAAAAAREALLAAEASDWFWWYGDEFQTPDRPVFDRLFRAYLAAAWRAAGKPVPEAVFEPIGPAPPPRHEPPTGPPPVRVDGRDGGYPEWGLAGTYRPEDDLPGLEPEPPEVKALRFGAGPEGVFLRVDLPGPAGPAIEAGLELEVRIRVPGGEPLRYRLGGGAPGGARFAAGEVLEAMVPWPEVPAPARAEFSILLLEKGAVRDRLPRAGWLPVSRAEGSDDWAA
ncbi:MAG: glycoside hydrolase family 57 protein [Planctomycetales bacterium]|nr:glycoside hydrolase family 57 protein [Planctomycetales bacterium]